MLVKNQNIGQKSKCWSKIGILVKNRSFGQARRLPLTSDDYRFQNFLTSLIFLILELGGTKKNSSGA